MAVKRIAVTGAAGHIAYSLLFRIASGEMFGKQVPIALHLIEIPDFISVLEGVKMELEDCAFPLLKEIRLGSDPVEMFADCDYALLIGAKPRSAGMERKDLLGENGKIFVEQGKALHKVGKPSTKVFVVGNPCNTNCLIAMGQGERIPRHNFFAMTRLDQNRSQTLLATKAKVAVEQVSHVTIWGNHSSTQVPDYFHAQVAGQPVTDVIADLPWLEEKFIETVQKRGAQVIAARGSSSAASAANAIIDMVRATECETPIGQWYSLGVCSDDSPYAIEKNLIFSFPCRTLASGQIEIVPKIIWNASLEAMIRESERELIEEREAVQAYL